MMTDQELRLQHILDKTIDNRKVFGISFGLQKGAWQWSGAAGDLTRDTPYYVASTTKLFTTAIILNLRSRGALSINDNIGDYLTENDWMGLHMYKNVDYSGHLTIEHLLAHTSGLPDYFQDKNSQGVSLERELIHGNDQSWTYYDVLSRTKYMKGRFIPGAKGKAHYSDTNFQLLGRIIEHITGRSYSDNCDELIIRPLKLANTYLYTDPSDFRPHHLYYKGEPLRIPMAMSSFGPDGSIVSTSSEMITFIKAFFRGKFFPESDLDALQQWKRIFFPMRSGIGLHLFRLPRIFDPLGHVPDFIGHSGLSGALAYYAPDKDLFIAGTVNQVAYPDLSFRTMVRLAQVVLK